MQEGKVIVSAGRFDLIIRRLCHQVLESHLEPDKLCIIGIQERGVLLAERFKTIWSELLENRPFPYGKLDITFYRDDFRIREKPLRASSTTIDFTIENKDVLLIDDVLYTGRTVHAAIAALQDFGRPRKIEMLCLVDRRFNRHFPIKADYVGLSVDAIDEAYVRVNWKKIHGEDRILLFAGQEEKI